MTQHTDLGKTENDQPQEPEPSRDASLIDDSELCTAEYGRNAHTGAWCYGCTLPKGHAGDHEAWGFSDVAPIVIWPQEVAE